MIGNKSAVFRFTDVEVREREFSLIKSGKVSAVEPKAFRVLIILLRNPQKLISKEELLKAVWGDVVVTENSLTRSIALLRRLLGDDTRNPCYIETVTAVGYRFLCPVEVAEDTTAKFAGAKSEVQPAVSRQKLMRRFLLAAIAAICLLAVAWLFRPHYPKPRVTGEIQLTADSTLKWDRIATDGRQVYFTEVLNGRQTIAAVSTTGGQSVPLKLPFQAVLYDISPDKTDLLVAETDSPFRESPLWRVPIIGGTPRRLGNVAAHDASWSPDGTRLAYVVDSGLYLANADGSDARVFLAPTGVPDEWAWRPVWSPDGRHLRFTYYEMETHKAHIWEINTEGSNPHVLFADSAGMQGAGDWTPDGKYFVFSSWNAIESGNPWPAANLWAMREKADPFHRSSALPTNLTTGPIRYFIHALSPDGKTIFAQSLLKHGELMRYDPRTKSFSLYASGLSAEGVSFSRDGKWVAYVKYPQGELWRSRVDGTEPLQLSSRPLFASAPAWSPDGKQIAFNGTLVGELAHSYLVSADGGGPRRIDKIGEGLDPTWSPDGSSLAFMDDDHDNGGIRILNLQTGNVVPVAKSKTFIVPRTSPDGRWIVALSNNPQKLLLFNVQTQVWRELTQGNIILWPAWSRDSKYVYFARDREIFRIGVEGGTPELIVSLKDYHTTGVDPAWFSLTPEGDILFLRDTGGGTEIYALSWDAP